MSILKPPKRDTADVLYDLIQGKVVKEREYNVNSFRDIISRLKRIHGIPLRHVDVEAKTRHGEVRRYRKHFLLSIHRKKAIRVYEKINN
jgi:hypothetical protein